VRVEDEDENEEERRPEHSTLNAQHSTFDFQRPRAANKGEIKSTSKSRSKSRKEKGRVSGIRFSLQSARSLTEYVVPTENQCCWTQFVCNKVRIKGNL
jgi:hypothetical protein